MGLRDFAWVAFVELVGCGDAAVGASESSSGGEITMSVPTTSGDDTTAEPGLTACPEPDGVVSVVSALEACLDAACAEIDGEGFTPVGEEKNGALYTDFAFECRVDGVVKMDGEQWRLTDCTGADAPASGSVRLSFSSTPALGLPLVVGERVRVAFHTGATYGNDHRSWSLRRTDDTLLAVVSFGLALPPDPLAVPLELKGDPHACGEPGPCGGYSGSSDLVVSLGGTDVRVAGGTVDTSASTLPYAIVVSLAAYDGPSGCGVFDWKESYAFAVLART